MFAWMKKNRLALVVATLMFAVMAAVMAEFLVGDEFSLDFIFDGPEASEMGMLWAWRIGGLLTWPVFMWLLLRPYVDLTREGHQACLTRTLVIAALYGGGGLWLLSSLWTAVSHLSEEYLVIIAPAIAVLMLGMPYLYTWGFVAIYGFARDGFAGNAHHGWMGRSLATTVLGVYAIGPLIYAALSLVLVPVVVAADAMPGAVGEHVAFDLLAIALSTGNFCSQWFAFHRVDEWFAEQERQRMGMPAGAGPVVPSQTVTTMPDGTVVLPDGRLVTPDGHVYLPQSAPMPRAAAPAPAQPVASVPQPPQPAPQAPRSPEPPATPGPFDYNSKGM